MAREQAARDLRGFSSELASIVERVAPAVVRVDDGQRLTASGIIWSADGIILASSHGVERDEELAIELADGVRHAVTLVGRDPDTDLAVLRAKAEGLPAVESADPGEAKIGSLVLALGRPGTWGLHSTLGIISARLDTERGGEPGYILHTDAVLYPGFSGGALVGMSGRILGITNLLFGRGKGVAIGMPVVSQVAKALLAHGRVRRAFLGIGAQSAPLPKTLVGELGLQQERALLVVQVESGSPAERGGLLLGDVLLGIGEQAVQDVEDLRHELRALEPGRPAMLRILRGGELRELAVTLGGS
jgi:S1-C subfamily serine protease